MPSILLLNNNKEVAPPEIPKEWVSCTMGTGGTLSPYYVHFNESKTFKEGEEIMRFKHTYTVNTSMRARLLYASGSQSSLTYNKTAAAGSTYITKLVWESGIVALYTKTEEDAEFTYITPWSSFKGNYLGIAQVTGADQVFVWK